MKNSYTEFTYSDGENEVMVHHRTSDDKVIRLYMYADQVNNFEGYESQRTGKIMTPFSWKPGKNALFVHLKGPAMQRFYNEFMESGELICAERESSCIL